MGTLVVVAIVAVVVYGIAHQAGKREGSKKAYHVGRVHERRKQNKNSSGCMVVLVFFGTIATGLGIGISHLL